MGDGTRRDRVAGASTFDVRSWPTGESTGCAIDARMRCLIIIVVMTSFMLLRTPDAPSTALGPLRLRVVQFCAWKPVSGLYWCLAVTS
jgi:hypothetical protein